MPSAPVGKDGTGAWLEAVGEACGVSGEAVEAAKAAALPAVEDAVRNAPVEGRVTLSGYEGSELLVARLLIECGADVRYVSTAVGHTPWAEPDRAWLEERGVQVRFRATLEDDTAAVAAFEPDLAVGTTPVVQYAKERSIPGLYFTNLISARPLMGPAGPASLAQVVNAAIGNKARFDAMTAFFDGVGEEDRTGTWVAAPPEGVDGSELFRAEDTQGSGGC